MSPSEAAKARWSNPEYRAKMLARMKERWEDKAQHEAASLAAAEKWTRDDYREKMKGRGPAIARGVTKALTPLPTYFQSSPRALAMVVEVFGDYWHQGEDPSVCIDAFAAAGYKCAVIWEHEMKSKPLIEILQLVNERL